MRTRSERNFKQNKPIGGILLSLIQLLLTALFLALIFKLDILPLKYTLVAAGFLGMTWVLVFLSQIKLRFHVFGKVVSVLVSLVLILGSFYIYKTNSTIQNVVGNSNTKVTGMVVVVMKDDPAMTLPDAKSYTFGIQSSIKNDNTDKAVEEINARTKSTIKTEEYDGFDAQINALYSGEVKAIIYDSAFDGTIKEFFTDYEDKVRVLDSIAITEETVPEVTEPDGSKITKEPFNIFISGIDVYGDISQTSRSDVNIIATVNPETKTILLTTTPRDYYVEFPGVTDGKFDKLTHAGIYGVDTSMETLGEIYDIKVSNYIRINFTSFIDIIDALDGVSVHSEQTFSAGSFTFIRGENKMDGEKALVFARERKSFVDGDFQRGRNQMEVLKAVIKKLSSSALLTNYAAFMDTLSDSIQTDFSSGQIRSLVRMQTTDNAAWNIQTIAAKGTPAMRYCYSYSGSMLSVDLPDEDSIALIKNYMQRVMDGETIKIEK